MYKSIVLIGLGSLGGFVAENLSRMKGLETLILIDHDFVNSKNIGKSIYRSRDVGKLKIQALSSLINNDNLTVKGYPVEYIEGKNYLPEHDLIIDCRDEICSRGWEIDIRFYISYKTLVIDCEKYHKVSFKQTGKYAHLLTLSELAVAASIASQYIGAKILKEFLKKQIVFQAPIDLVQRQAKDAIDLYDNKPDMVLNQYKGDTLIRNLHETLPKLIQVNRTKDLTVIIGQEGCVGCNLQVINKNEITEYDDAVRTLSEIVSTTHPCREYYTIQVNDSNKDEVYIELLPDTGAA
jgi:hypothetical protein